MFNPSVKDFMEENKEVTVIGLYWAGLWRLYLCIFAVCIGLTIVSTILTG